MLLAFVTGMGCSKGPVPLGAEEGPPPDNLVTHAFGVVDLKPLEDDATRCASWTLHNDEPLYVSAVRLENEGLFHHSNWFVVPEDSFEGPDGYWTCGDRGFNEVIAGALGTVLTAQSTQSFEEEERLGGGAVIKIPPHWKVVGGLHTLNAANRADSSHLWMTLELAHPRDVRTVVVPIGMEYQDLDLPPASRSAFSTDCEWNAQVQASLDVDLRMAVHYVLPHYHYLGDQFQISVVGGPQDGQVVYDFSGFDGEADGRTFDPPVEIDGAEGLRLTCGYDNYRDEHVYWGNGDGEMCVALILADADAVLAGTVIAGSRGQGAVDDVKQFEGPCLPVIAPKGDAYALPTKAEKDAPLYVPPEDDETGPVGPVCHDTPADAVPEDPVTFDSVRDEVFAPSCTFSSCHGPAAAGTLDLASDGLYQRLLDHPVMSNVDLPLIDPGNADGSWLYQELSKCTPTDREGNGVAHMPANAPILLDDPVVAKVRAWIDAGAPEQ